MEICRALKLNNRKAVISICGGGGKTSTLFRLANELKEKKVLITTTTKILIPEKSDSYDLIIENESGKFLNRIKNENLKKVIVCGTMLPANKTKLIGCTEKFVNEVKDYFDFIIIEADGSAGRPIKAPADHEPVVPYFTDIYIGVIGLDCLGKPGNSNNVHRPQLFSIVRDKEINEPVSEEDLVKLIDSPSGLFKFAPEKCMKVVLLNKADLLELGKCIKIINNITIQAKNYNYILLNTFKKKDSVIMSVTSKNIFGCS